MDITLINGCCESCWHTVAKPCPHFLDCLNTSPKCHESANCKDRNEKLFAELRRQNVTRPVIFVGVGTCGLAAGAKATLDKVRQYITVSGVEADVVETGCVGLCSAEPILDVQMPGRARLMFERITDDKVDTVLSTVLQHGKASADALLGQYENNKHQSWQDVPYVHEHPFFKPQTRWVLRNCGIIDPTSINEYIAHGGYQAFASVIKSQTPEEVCDQVENSGLRGRGGGGFPTGKKWKFAQSEVANQKYLICNADEGDPGAFMDRAVIEGDPHRLLEGMAIAAYGIGVSKAYIYIRAEYPLAIERLKMAIAQAEAYGFLGRNILDSGMNLKIVIKMGAGAFVCGEETALIHSIEGKRGMPRPRPPFPAVSGLFNKPTIINNVETLANLPRVLANGPDAFSALGTESSKGTKVFALSGKVARTGLVEVAMGTRVRDIIFEIGGGVGNNRAYKAVQIGGPSGGCITEEHLDIEVDYESLKRVGAMMGSGGLVVMDEDNCMVDVAKFFMDFIQRESCGKCIPCREGTRRMLETLESLTRARRHEEGCDSLERFRSVVYIQRLAETIKDTSLCGLGQSAPNPVLSTLKYFREEYEAHVYERRCPAGVCTDLLTFSIDEEACVGCTACARKCPTGAIKGVRKSPHYIVAEKCIGCGACFTVCKFDAVLKG
ncbi:MAG: NADH-quinone oxidoreductase subunit NuoF [Sedimentisphaerales bacterium]|nr:NADH-quinone oxidoreductase subunit NuoF [Sedimentisphaerales bacterium]